MSRHHNDVVVGVSDASRIFDEELVGGVPKQRKGKESATRRQHRKVMNSNREHFKDTNTGSGALGSKFLPFGSRIQGLLVDVGDLEALVAVADIAWLAVGSVFGGHGGTRTTVVVVRVVSKEMVRLVTCDFAVTYATRSRRRRDGRTSDGDG